MSCLSKTGIAAFTGLIAVPASAATLSYSFDYAGVAESLQLSEHFTIGQDIMESVPRFDPAVGTLTRVNLRGTGEVTLRTTIANNSADTVDRFTGEGGVGIYARVGSLEGGECLTNNDDEGCSSEGFGVSATAEPGQNYSFDTDFAVVLDRTLSGGDPFFSEEYVGQGFLETFFAFGGHFSVSEAPTTAFLEFGVDALYASSFTITYTYDEYSGGGPVPVPTPGAVALLGLGAAALVLRRRAVKLCASTPYAA